MFFCGFMVTHQPLSTERLGCLPTWPWTPHRGAGEPAHVANRESCLNFKDALQVGPCSSSPAAPSHQQSERCSHSEVYSGTVWNDFACRRCGDMMLFQWLKSGTTPSGLLEARKRAHWSLATLAASSRQDSREKRCFRSSACFCQKCWGSCWDWVCSRCVF